MKIDIYQVDAFTDKVFGGNPAAVCPLKEWLKDEVMQNIAAENNLAETAFYVKEGDRYALRWFTPAVEVDLCGHATLAAAFVIFNFENHLKDHIEFYSPRSGKLSVMKNDDLYTLNFPQDKLEEVKLTQELTDGFNLKPEKAFKGKTDYILVYASEEDIKHIEPDFNQIVKINCRGIIVTAPGFETDFVSRFFAPQCGVNEDPVTGSAHTSLTPYWSNRLNKKELSAVQLSNRQGFLTCKQLKNRVEINGRATLYLKGTIHI